jgi:hypothetical protein
MSQGAKLLDAYKAAGFEGRAHTSAWKLRHDPRVDARIIALAERRAKAGNDAFVRRAKKSGDILDAAVRRLADLALTDPREVFAWKNEPVLNADGEVTGERTRLVVRDSKDISPAAATLIKGAFVKAGEVKIETYDQRAALVDLVKILKGDDVATQSVTVNQVNVGSVDAVTAAQRVAFMLAAASHHVAARPAAPVTIEGERVHNSRSTDGDKPD